MFEEGFFRQVVRSPWLWIPWLAVILFLVSGPFLWWYFQESEQESRYWLLISLLGVAALALGFDEVEVSSPASVALLTVWGRPKEVGLSPGIWLMANYPPFLISFVRIPIENQNLDFTFPNTRCRLTPKTGSKGKDDPKHAAAGGEVEVDISVTVLPNEDPQQLVKYIKAGGLTTSKSKTNETITVFHDQLRDLFGEAIRSEGAHRTWVQMSFAQMRLRAILVRTATGEYPNADEDDENFDEEARKFIDDLLKNGKGDVHDLGSLIRRLSVVRVVPTGKLLEDAEAVARELQQADKQRQEQIFRRQEARKMVKAARDSGDETLTFKQALQILRIDEEKTAEKVIEVRGDASPIVQAAGVVNEGLEK